MADLTDMDQTYPEALTPEGAGTVGHRDDGYPGTVFTPGGGTADAAVSNTAPSGGEGSTPSQGTVIGHKVLSARVNLVSRHFHVADLVGDGFYVEGVRMKHAVCRTCGEQLEDRHA